MELDAKKLIGMVAPLAIAYMTWTSVQSGLSVLNNGVSAPAALAHLAAVTKGTVSSGAMRNPFAPIAADESPQGALALLQSLTGAAGEEAETGQTPRPYRLSGTVIAGKLRMAIINGERVNEGDSYQGLRLAKVETNHVLLTGHGRSLVVPMEVTQSDQIARQVDARGPAAAAAPSPAAQAAVASAKPASPAMIGLRALTAGSQGDVLQMLGIPAN